MADRTTEEVARILALVCPTPLLIAAQAAARRSHIVADLLGRELRRKRAM
jgi:hypothetical protein